MLSTRNNERNTDIIYLKASINRGLTDELKAAFTDTVPALKLLTENGQILAQAKSWGNYEKPLTGSSEIMGQCMAGFASGEGWVT